MENNVYLRNFQQIVIKFIPVPLGWFWIKDSNICETNFNVIQIINFHKFYNEIILCLIQSLDMIIGSIDQVSMTKDHDVVFKDLKSLMVLCVAFVFQQRP